MRRCVAAAQTVQPLDLVWPRIRIDEVEVTHDHAHLFVRVGTGSDGVGVRVEQLRLLLKVRRHKAAFDERGGGSAQLGKAEGFVDEAGLDLDSVGVVSEEVGHDRDDAETGAEFKEGPAPRAQITERSASPTDVGLDEIGKRTVVIAGEAIEHRSAFADERLEHVVRQRAPIGVIGIIGWKQRHGTGSCGRRKAERQATH